MKYFVCSIKFKFSFVAVSRNIPIYLICKINQVKRSKLIEINFNFYFFQLVWTQMENQMLESEFVLDEQQEKEKKKVD